MKAYAFWRYDTFPFVLHGEVVAGPDDKGRVQVKGYANARDDGTYGGGWFMPIKLLSIEAGQPLGKQLDLLRAEHNRQHKAVDVKMKLHLSNLMPEAIQ